jgi:DNA-binding PadR family transcriptional regulator
MSERPQGFGKIAPFELERRVLSILDPSPLYGYDICVILDLHAGDVYPTLRRLEGKGLVSGHWLLVSADKPPRRRYSLSGKGIEKLGLL